MNNYHKNDQITKEIRSRLVAALPALPQIPDWLHLEPSRSKNRWRCKHHQDSEHTDHIQIRPDGTWYCHGCNTGGLDSVSLALHYMTWKQLLNAVEMGSAPSPVTARTVSTLSPYPVPHNALADLWENMQQVKFFDSKFNGYFQNRKIDPTVAIEYGCRPISSTKLKNLAPDLSEYLGLHRPFFGEYGDGILIPCYLPGYIYPVSYRVRIYGSEIKESSPLSPQGYKAPERPAFHWRFNGQIQHVLFVDGFPDFLTAATLFNENFLIVATVDGNFRKIHLPLMNLTKVTKVIDMTHKKVEEQSRERRKSHFHEWMNLTGIPYLESYNLDEDCDLNDLVCNHGADIVRANIQEIL